MSDLSFIKNQRGMIEIIKLSINSFVYMDLSPKLELIQIIKLIYWWYELGKKSLYLESCILHIVAYMEMGYDYLDLFDEILQESHINKEELCRYTRIEIKIKLNKSQVRGIIGKWKAGNEIKITDVVDDIIKKVSKQEMGIFYYENGKKRPGIINDRYELVITENECYFHDIKKNKFYTFVQ